MKQRSILTAVATLALMFIASTAFAQGNGALTEKFDFENNSYYNPCCDEWVNITGTIHFTFKIKNNADGSMTISQNSAVSSVKGTGSNGTNYVGSETSKFSQTLTVNEPYPFSIQQSVYHKLIGTGADGHDCTARVKFTFTFEVDADGNVVVDDVELEFICANGTEIN